MEQLAPVGPVYQAGTLSGNPLATAAGRAVLSLLEPGVYEELSRRVERLAKSLRNVLGPGVQVPVAGPLLGFFFTTDPVTDYDGARASASTGRYPGLMHGLLERGVAIAPGAYEILFPSLSHGDAEMELAVEAFAAAWEP
jgi:glutamate-1-semialdehyde 2,1-aminomutase